MVVQQAHSLSFLLTSFARSNALPVYVHSPMSAGYCKLLSHVTNSSADVICPMSDNMYVLSSDENVMKPNCVPSFPTFSFGLLIRFTKNGTTLSLKGPWPID